eukprot:snap_masked-scaffold_13-processed-gene-11.26-mRNA-1 protein AED:1.00 eAED:1.00 QI:0/-1/0/0/-1/1/1/0/71
MNELGKALRLLHQYTISYAKPKNDGAEIKHSRILRAVRVWVSELRLEMTEWADVTSAIVHYTNNRLTKRNL